MSGWRGPLAPSAEAPFWEQLPPKESLPIVEDYEERAAIIEFLAGAPRAEAERLAYDVIVRRHVRQEALPL